MTCCLLHTITLPLTRFSLVSVSLVCFGLLSCYPAYCAEPLRVVSYNVENLFHPKHDSVLVDGAWREKEDGEWTPEGERKWTFTKYYRKTENIARVLTNIGEWSGVDVIGLQEVENAAVVKRLCYTLRRGEYDFVHYESPDKRGIDVAFVYKKARVDTLATKALPVCLQSAKHGAEDTTRDILYVCAQIDKRDTIHFFVCHLPSQRNGAAASEWKREQAKQVLQRAVDSVLAADRDAQIIVMGDMNSAPKEDVKGLKNRMTDIKGKGTHKYHGQWTCLDQFYTSASMDSISHVTVYDAEWIQETDEKYLGLKPKRTYNGYHYNKDGFSDHLPIVLECQR